MTGFNGSELIDVVKITLVFPLSSLFQQLVILNMRDLGVKISGYGQLLLDFILILIPMLLTIIWNDKVDQILGGLILMCLGLFIALRNKGVSWKSLFQDELPFKIVKGVKHIGFISRFRSLLQISTCLVILAVDFPSFPRKFCKGEEYGFSLMDMGTGTVLFIGGIIARQIREKEQTFLTRIKQSLSNSIPLFFLGFMRFFLNRKVNYQEHYSEYGVHWNFFLTLGFVAFLSAFLNLKNKSFEVLALILMVFYQVGLDVYDLKKFIYTAPRKDIFSANKEGILGMVGFFSLYLLGLSVGADLRDRSGLYEILKSLCRKAFKCFLIFCLSLYSSGPVSRRLMNVQYVTWIAWTNLMMLALFAIFDALLSKKIMKYFDDQSHLIDVVNLNQILYFLLSNLLTGLVNLTFKTIFLGFWPAFTIIIIYQLIAISIIRLLWIKKWKFKFW